MTQDDGDFNVQPKILSHATVNTQILADNIGLYSRNYDALFDSLIATFATDFNIKYEDGFGLSSLPSPYGPAFFVLAVFTQNTVLTPNKLNEYIYAGLSAREFPKEYQDNLE